MLLFMQPRRRLHMKQKPGLTRNATVMRSVAIRIHSRWKLTHQMDLTPLRVPSLTNCPRFHKPSVADKCVILVTNICDVANLTMLMHVLIQNFIMCNITCFDWPYMRFKSGSGIYMIPALPHHLQFSICKNKQGKNILIKSPKTLN